MLRKRLAQIEHAVSKVGCAGIALYRIFLSPLLGPRCRFWPSCSSYALQALAKHGLWRGTWLTLKRLGRCHPWHPGGIDYVPLTSVKTDDSLK